MYVSTRTAAAGSPARSSRRGHGVVSDTCCLYRVSLSTPIFTFVKPLFQTCLSLLSFLLSNLFVCVSCFALNSLHLQTPMSTDAQTHFLGTPLVPLLGGKVRSMFTLRIVRPIIVESTFRKHCAKELDGALRKPPPSFKNLFDSNSKIIDL